MSTTEPRRRERICPGRILVATLALALFPSCQKAYNAPVDPAEAVRLIDFSCRAGRTERIEKWGHSGASRACYKEEVRDGRIIFWEEGYLNLEGFYRNGAKDGTWTVFNGDGSVFCEILFEEGVKKEKIYR